MGYDSDDRDQRTVVGRRFSRYKSDGLIDGLIVDYDTLYIPTPTLIRLGTFVLAKAYEFGRHTQFYANHLDP